MSSRIQSRILAKTVRIEPAAYAALAEVARLEHVTLTEALTRAIQVYRRDALIRAMSEDYGELKSDPTAWAAEQSQRAAWDHSLGDGLDREPA